MRMMRKFVISWATWKFVNIDVIFLNKIIGFIFASWTADRLFGWLFSYFFFFVVGWLVGLVGWLWFILVLVDCLLGCTTIISLLDFTKHKSSADHNGWQPGCKWTFQIWNVTHCLGALEHGQSTYTYEISQFLRKAIGLHSWIEQWLIFSVILVWQFVEKNSINFCPGV